MFKASSKLSLLSEINKRKEAASNAKSNAPEAPSASRSKGKTSKEIKQNAGLLKRLAKDELAYATMSEENATSGHQRQSILLAKAKLYEKLRKGDSAGLTEAQRASLSVDFDAKATQEWDDMVDQRKMGQTNGSKHESESGESDSDSSDEEPTSGVGPLVEVVDDFGRARMVPQSQAPKIQAMEQSQAAKPEDVSALPDA